MSSKLPKFFEEFRAAYPEVAANYHGLSEACKKAGPLDERTAELVKLGLAIGRLTHDLMRLTPAAAVHRLTRDHDLDARAAENRDVARAYEAAHKTSISCCLTVYWRVDGRSSEDKNDSHPSHS